MSTTDLRLDIDDESHRDDVKDKLINRGEDDDETQSDVSSSYDDEFERSLATTAALNKKRSVYISEQGKKNLAKYKYSGSDHSLISPFLQPFWNWVVNYLPESMAYVEIMNSQLNESVYYFVCVSKTDSL